VKINLPVSQEHEISLPADLQVYSHVYFVNSTVYSCKWLTDSTFVVQDNFVPLSPVSLASTETNFRL
jgi:hypothetical protein